MSQRPSRHPTYDGGIAGVLDQMEARRDPLEFGPGEALPALDCDLDALCEQVVFRPVVDPDLDAPTSTYGRKQRLLRAEFAGHPEICYLNGMLIANLRRRDQPKHTAALFLRLWQDHGAFLLARLDLRWLVSSLTTFGDHGATEVQRRVGQTLSVLLNTIKLYESERLFSGYHSDTPFTLRGKAKSDLPMEMDAFSLEHGGLDVNMLGRLWQDAEGDPVIQPLAHHLLNELIHDPSNVFRRLRRMRARKLKRRAQREAAAAESPDPAPRPARAGGTSWGVVSTIKAPAGDILRFVAHHLSLGADRVHVFLDAPCPSAEAVLSDHPKVALTTCDDAYWARQGRTRMPAHQLRQAFNATRCYRASHLDWLAHIDVDEFLLPDRDMADILAAVPPGDDFLRAHPVELLAPLDASPDAPGEWRYFKRTPVDAGQDKSVTEDILPNFGRNLRQGFISHTVGKILARTRLTDVRLGIHALKRDGVELKTGAVAKDMVLAHAHAASWPEFRDKVAFRLSEGSYRNKNPQKLGLQEILEFVQDSEGEPGLRAFYAEMCEAQPDIMERLKAHDMLIDRPLDLDAAVAQEFGASRHKEAGE